MWNDPAGHDPISGLGAVMDDAGGEDCGAVGYDFFGDVRCNDQYAYICEVSCESSPVIGSNGIPIPEWNQLLTLTSYSNEGVRIAEIRAFNETRGRVESVLYVAMSTEAEGFAASQCYDGDFATICRTNPAVNETIKAYFFGKVSLVQLIGLEGTIQVELGMKSGQVLFSEEVQGDFAISQCPAGTFVSSTSTVLGCSVCPGGKFSLENANECLNCAAGTYSIRASSSCSACEMGTFSGDSASTCSECEAGTYGNDTGLTQCLDCLEGYFSDARAEDCEPCPVGKFSDEKQSEECTSCSSGTFANETGLSECYNCLLGKYSSIESPICHTCEQGKYNDVERASECKQCASGKFSSAMGAKSVDTCEDCIVGTFTVIPNTIQCELCPFGTFQDVIGSSSCTSCPSPLSTRIKGATTPADCGECSAGFYNNGNIDLHCVACPIGTYSNSSGSNSEGDCRECEIGRYASTTGLSSCSFCPIELTTKGKGATSLAECSECAYGSYSDESLDICVSCPQGKYGGGSGIDSCLSCPIGKFSNVTNAASISSCQECPIGTYGNGLAATSCLYCPAGKYGEISGEELSTRCLECPAGRFSSTEGGQLISSCEFCAIGTYSDVDGKTECFPCDYGTYGTMTNSTSMDDCQLCPRGFYGDTEGAHLSSSCKQCEIGSFTSTEGQSSCNLCDPGRYGNVFGGTSIESCSFCPTGRFSYTSGNQYIESCQFCEEGTYSDEVGQSKCTECPAGRFGSLTGSSSVRDCEFCPIGKFGNETGLVSLNNCTVCEPGTFADVIGQSSCTECLPGRYVDTSGSDSADDCLLCPIGTFGSDFGMSSVEECLPCNPGTYGGELGLFVCTACPIGKYGDESSSETIASCKSCPKGRYSDVNGTQFEEGCTMSPKGTYLPFEGATSASQAIHCLNSIGMSCPAGSTYPLIREGYYWKKDDPNAITRCYPANSCKATSSGSPSCAKGFEGKGCAQCINQDYYRLQSQCVSCTSGWIRFVFVVLAFTTFLVFTFFFMSQRGTDGLGLRLGFSFLQIIVTYPKLSSDWDPVLLGLFEVSSIVNANFQLLGLSCFVNMSYWTSWHLKLVSPFLFGLILFIIFQASHFLKKMFFNHWIVEGSKFIYFFNLIMLTFYISFISTVSEPLNCVKQYGDSYGMLTDMSIECYTSDWNEQIPAIVVYTLLYFVCVPASILYLTLKARRTNLLSDENFVTTFGCFTKMYDAKYFYWEVVSMIEKCLIVSIADFLSISTSSTLRIICVLVVLITFGSLDVILQPYKNRHINRLNYLWMSTATLMLIATFVYRAKDTDGPEQLFFTVFLLMLLSSAILFSFKSFMDRLWGTSTDEMVLEKEKIIKLWTKAKEMIANSSVEDQKLLLEGVYKVFKASGVDLKVLQRGQINDYLIGSRRIVDSTVSEMGEEINGHMAFSFGDAGFKMQLVKTTNIETVKVDKQEILTHEVLIDINEEDVEEKKED